VVFAQGEVSWVVLLSLRLIQLAGSDRTEASEMEDAISMLAKVVDMIKA